MNHTIWLCILVIILAAYWSLWRERRRRQLIQRRRRKKGEHPLNELVRRCLGKHCLICLGGMGADLEGTVEEIEGNWISLRTKKGVELVNLDYINRIQEKREKTPKA